MKQNEILNGLVLTSTAALLVSCAPTVRLDTPEPVKIDVAMKVDVYTHEEQSSGTAEAEKQLKTPQERRRYRMQEVQELKNDRVVGEGNTGFLVVKNPPTDPVYADYAQKIVTQENDDRNLLFKQEAAAEEKPVDVVAKEFSKRARESSFPDEWIQEDDGTWVQR
ncbi:MAG: DUF1318 domain-containing protein [Verrucomicrobiota bacterium]